MTAVVWEIETVLIKEQITVEVISAFYQKANLTREEQKKKAKYKEFISQDIKRSIIIDI